MCDPRARCVVLSAGQERAESLLPHSSRRGPEPFDLGTSGAGRSLWLVCLVLGVAVGSLSCGRKGDLKLPGAVAPEAIRDLSAQASEEAIILTWSRPTQHVDGTRMDSLAGFVVFRKSTGMDPQCQSCASEYQEAARVPIEDQGMIRKAKRIRLVQRGLTPRTLYRYKVFSFTADGSRSDASNEAEVAWQALKK